MGNSEIIHLVERRALRIEPVQNPKLRYFKLFEFFGPDGVRYSWHAAGHGVIGEALATPLPAN